MIQCLMLENLLHSPNADLRDEEKDALLGLLRQRNPYLDPNSTEFQDAMRMDPYYNALQVRYGYAMTCHKAQGGEWQQVVTDLKSVSRDSEYGKRWLYTAVTRASESLLVVTA